ncbi:cation:proton antiporter [Niabella insulamsoli]|uniref:cation:proton antiporter n=1 Tax=Niabella insulamsoli TaxID=3144874 RepID=UPI0031FC7835
MNHLPHLITDLALILGVASVITVIFKRLQLPLILGYLVAGILISPNFKIFPPKVYEITDVQIWGEIGVIFLLFSLGLEFSFKKLAKMGGSATTAAGFEAVGMAVVGYMLGKLLNWPFMDCIFLGACLTISSSSVIVKSFSDLGLKQRNFAQLVYGILVVEDLIAVVLLVLLGTFVASNSFDAGELGMSILKLVFFLIVWFVGGILLIPTLLKRAKNFLTDEILLIVAVAMCFLMVYLSSQAGFSAALGAFIMGSLLAETTKAERIEHLVIPVRDLFGAIFFVSVGMLIDLNVIKDHWLPILLITAAVVIGKSFVITLGAFISGNGLRTSIQTGMSLALIGEFSFIIASMGVKQKVVSEELYPIIITVSALTIFIAPWLTISSTRIYNWINKRLSAKWETRLNRYSVEATALRAVSDWNHVLKFFLINTVVFSAIVIAIIAITNTYISPWLEGLGYNFGRVTSAILGLMAMVPFLWALIIRNEKTEPFARLYTQQKYHGPIWIMRIIKMALALFFIILFLQNVYSLDIALYVGIVLLVVILIFRKRLQKTYDKVEDRFVKNLNNREIEQQRILAELDAQRRDQTLAPWDAHLTTFEVSAEAVNVIGKTLEELQWRERVGVNVVMIKRGVITIIPPERQDRIYPGDKLFIICTDSQERRMNVLLRPDKKLLKNNRQIEMKLEQLVITADSPFLYKTIRESDIRDKAHGLVVGIERNGQRFLNPESNWVFEEGDVVWIAGEKKLIEHIED